MRTAQTMFLTLTLVASLGCGSEMSTPPVPNPIAPTSPSLSPMSFLQPLSFAGIVIDDEGLPVSGATVTLLGFDGDVEAITDGGGAFRAQVAPYVGGLSAIARKDKFQEGEYWLELARASSLTIRLHRELRVEAGNSVRFVIDSSGPLCGLNLDYFVRRILIHTPKPGTLNVSVKANGLGVPLGVGDCADAVPEPLPAMSKHIAAGAHTPVDVLLGWAATRAEATVTTEFVPD